MIRNNKVSFRNTENAFGHLSDKELKSAYRLFSLMNRRWLVSFGMSLIKFALRLRLPIKGMIKKTIFKQFCGGETIKECHTVIHRLGNKRVGSIPDFSVEGVHNRNVLDSTCEEILKTIEAAKLNAHIPFCVFKVTGVMFSWLLEKRQSGKLLIDQEKEMYERGIARVEKICSAARDNQVRILIDAEETWIQDEIDQIALAMMVRYNQKEAIVFNTYQMYLKRSLDRLEDHYTKLSTQNLFMGVKLVRGAYMEKEREKAVDNAYESPIMEDKLATDKAYNLGLDFCLAHIDKIELCAGTHNEYSCQYLLELMDRESIDKNDERIWFVQLFGMGDHISFNLAAAGYNVAKYLPYGPVKYVMPYLFRRANENTSVADQASREFKMLEWEIKRRKVF